MSDFTRVTVVGARRRAEIVIDSAEPLGGLLPRMIGILGEDQQGIGPLTLIRSTGEELALEADAATQAILNGEVLRLIPRDDAPPPPEVTDVTGAVADSRDALPRWGRATRWAVGAGSLALVGTVGGVSVLGDLPDWGALGAVGAASAVLALVALVAGRRGAGWVALAATAVAVGLAVPVGAALAGATGNGYSVGLPAGVVWAWIVLALGLGVGLRVPGVLAGALIAGPVAVVALVLGLAEVASDGLWGITGILAVLLLGVLPSWALQSSGLARLDDTAAAGAAVERAAVGASLADAHATLTWSVGGLAALVGAAAVALSVSGNGWALGLACALVAVTVLRTRAFPGAVAGVLLWAAAAVPVVAGIAIHGGAWQLAGFAALAVVVALLAGIRPAEHTRARLRSLGNALEGIAVVATLPLLIGAFGVYGELLGTF